MNIKEYLYLVNEAGFLNSKNIYPDVIKKELPNFDNMFKDEIEERTVLSRNEYMEDE